MTPERWERLKTVFEEALDLDGGERDGFIERAFGEDSELLEQARRLLASDREAQSFLSEPPMGSLAPRVETRPLFAPEQVVAGRFRIVRFLARGGMGEVYEAEDLTLAARVALKAIQPRIAGTQALELFKQEILSARRVTHPNVCRIYDAAEHRDEESGASILLLTMELLEGPTLSRYLREHGPLSGSEALPLIAQICSGLQAAHDAGLVHGDFKSGNVILTKGPQGLRPAITDFGLARPAGSVPEQWRGTPGYTAPEQLAGGAATPASDVYALGVVVGRMTDRKPAGWTRAIARCVHQDPARRYQSPAEVAAALGRASPMRRAGWAIGATVVAAGAVFVGVAQKTNLRSPETPVQVEVKNIEPRLAERIEPAPMEASTPTSAVDQMADRRVSDGQVFAYLSVSADERYLVYADQATGDLAIRDLRTGANRILTLKPGGWEGSRAYAADAAISPDNRQIAYHWFDPSVAGPAPPLSELRVVSTEGGASKFLLPAGEHFLARPFEWSADSENVLVWRLVPGPPQTQQLLWVSAAEGTVRILKTLRSRPNKASLSPDGRFIAYDDVGETQGSRRAIFIIPVDGGKETIVTQNAESANHSPMWTPDGAQILFLSGRTGRESLWAIPVDQGRPTGPESLVRAIGVPPQLQFLAMTRSGALYYLASERRSNVFTSEVNAAMLAVQAPVLTAERFVHSNFAGVWSPGGESLVHFSVRGVDGLLSLVVRGGKTREERDVPTRIQYVGSPIRWFPDGRAVLTLGRQLPAESGEPALYKVNLTSGDSQLMLDNRPNDLAFYDLLEEGRAVLYTDFEPGVGHEGKLARFEVDTGEVTTLKRVVLGQQFRSLAVSPDGTQVAYMVEDRSTKESTIEVMPAGGGESREIYRGPLDTMPGYGGLAWSPDQRFVLFVRGTITSSKKLDVSIWWVPSVGGEARNTGITIHDAPGAGVLGYPSVHPDGRQIAYTLRETYTELRVLENFMPREKGR